MARWLLLIICGFLMLFVLSGSACSWVRKSFEKPSGGFERTRCVEPDAKRRDGDCFKFVVPKTVVGEKFLREKKQNARRAIA